MKQLLLSLSLFLLALAAHAQIGITGSYVRVVARDWEALFTDSDRYAFGPDFEFKPSYRLGVDYWFRLKNYRVEFFPTLSRAQFDWEQVPLQVSEPDARTQFGMTLWSLNLHTAVYPFDFEGDCHCPTWSKQNPFFKKGFFVQVSPGVTMARFNVTEPDAHGGTFTSDNTAFSIGAGVGVDIGITDFITITPFARVSRSFGVRWEGLNNRLRSNPESGATDRENNFDQLEAGIRFGIRWKK